MSILTPSFNHLRYVEQSIRSAWSQSHPLVEHIIVDDCSTDGSPELIERLVRNAPIPTTYLRNSQNLGPGRTVNKAFANSRGEWVCFLASDDAYAPNKLERLLARSAELGPEYGLIHGDCWSMNERGEVGERLYERSVIRPAEGSVFQDYALGRVGVNGLGVIIRRDVFQTIGGNDPSLLAEDFDFYLRLARITRFGYLDEPVAFVRTLSTSLGRNPARYMSSIFLALERQRDALGPAYDEALHTLHLRAFESFARYGAARTAMKHAAFAVTTSPAPTDALRALELISLTAGRELTLRTIAPLLPNRVRGALRDLNRMVTRRLYGVPSPIRHND